MKPSIGIEIHQETIRVMKIRESGMVIELEKMGTEPVPAGLIGPQGPDGNRAVHTILENLLKSHSISLKGGNVSLSLFSQLGVLRILSLPQISTEEGMSEEEIYKGLKYNVEQELAFELGEIVADYFYNKSTSEVVILAVRKTLVDWASNLISSFGGKLRVLEFPFLSLSRFLGDETKGKVLVILTLEDYSTEVALVREGIPYQISSIPKGLQDFLECVPSLATGSTEESKVMQSKLDPIVNQISIELVRSLKSYELRKLPPLPVEILLAGKWKSFSLWNQIVATMEERFNLPTSVIKFPPHLPLINLQQETLNNIAEYASVIGLSMVPFGKDRGFNLLAPVQKAKTSPLAEALEKFSQNLALKAAAAAVFLLGLAVPSFVVWHHHHKHPIAHIASPQQVAVVPKPQPVVPVKEAAARTQSAGFLQIVEDAINSATTMAEGNTLEDLTWDSKGSLVVKGDSITESGVFIYLNNLNGSTYFQQATLVDMKTSKDGSEQFTIQATFNPEVQPPVPAAPMTTESQKHFSLILADLGDAAVETGNSIDSLKKGEDPSTVEMQIHGNSNAISRFLVWLSQNPERVFPQKMDIESKKGERLRLTLYALLIHDTTPQPKKISVPATKNKTKNFIPDKLFENAGAENEGVENKETSAASGATPSPVPTETYAPAPPWILKGIVQVQGKGLIAYLEQGKKGYFVKAGDAVGGAHVLDVSPTSVTLQVGSKVIHLKLKQEAHPQ